MAKRKSTGKRQRFEIFKRDGFKCSYCGRSPPDVLLHIDHVIAVANGGSNDPTNLVTACADCNGGKSAVPLGVVAPSLQKQAEEARERAEQVWAYSAMLAEIRASREDDALDVWHAFSRSLEWPDGVTAGPNDAHVLPSDDRLRSIRHFLTKLTVSEMHDAVDIAASAAERQPDLAVGFSRDNEGRLCLSMSSLERRFRYFCGVCWNAIRQRGGVR